MDRKEMWKKILGRHVQSFTDETKTYTVFYDGDKYECSCPDYQFRGGSYNIIWIEPENNMPKIQRGCKHIAKVLKDDGKLEVQVFRIGE